MRVCVALFIPLALTACASSGTSGSSAGPAPSGGAPQAAAQSGDAAHAWVSRVSALGTSGTQLFGTVRLSPSGKSGEYKVAIELRGAKLGNKIPWSISTGQCGEQSSTEIGNRVQYRTIEASADGTARVSSTLQVNLTDNSSYHVNFYASPTERERIVSCGPLVTGT